MLEMYRRDRSATTAGRSAVTSWSASTSGSRSSTRCSLQAAAAPPRRRLHAVCVRRTVVCGSHFCANCGRPVPPRQPVVACAQCGTPLPADAMFCAVCGEGDAAARAAGARRRRSSPAEPRAARVRCPRPAQATLGAASSRRRRGRAEALSALRHAARPHQEYCLECGHAAPSGAVLGVSRACWRARFGRVSGRLDLAGRCSGFCRRRRGIGAIALADAGAADNYDRRDRGRSRPRPETAPDGDRRPRCPPNGTPTGPPRPPTAPPPPTTTAPAPGSLSAWPAGESGWTIVLISLPTRRAAHWRCERARAASPRRPPRRRRDRLEPTTRACTPDTSSSSAASTRPRPRPSRPARAPLTQGVSARLLPARSPGWPVFARQRRAGLCNTALGLL